jgi:hypothetical protein
MNKVEQAILVVIALGLVMIALSVHAQPPAAPNDTLAIVHPEGKSTTFFWLRIAACAKDEQHPHYAYCRSWLDAREEGRKEC